MQKETSITTEENKIYQLPTKIQPAALHSGLIKQRAFLKIKICIKKRYQFRRVWISLTAEMKWDYIDDENFKFSNQ